MTKNNLIKLTQHVGVGSKINLIDMLPKDGSIERQNYRKFNFEIIGNEICYLGSLFNSEVEILKDKIISQKIEPSDKWHVNKDFYQAQALLQACFIFLRAYIEDVVNFITLYLKDLENSGISVEKINTGKAKYENLKRLDIKQNDLDTIKKIRGAKIHGNYIEYNLAFKKIENKKLEYCLICVEYKNLKEPLEKEYLSCDDLNEAIETVGLILKKFSNYVKNLIRA